MGLRDSEKFKVLQQKAVELCELPKGGLSTAMSNKKKAVEIRYTVSPSRLSFMACALLSNETRQIKQRLLEMDDIGERIKILTSLINQEIEVSHL
jgi:hypothetical protein